MALLDASTECRKAGVVFDEQVAFNVNMVERIFLDGKWTLTDEKGDSFPAQVPGCVHTDLMASDCIPDPHEYENEGKVAWVGERIWTYTRKFSVPGEWLTARQTEIVLVAEGLDTLSRVAINGKEVGCADNMFRRWEFPAAAHLRKGENELSIRFEPPFDRIAHGQALRFYSQAGIGARIAGSCRIRKEQCQFGWDWGPKLVTCGIWLPIYLEQRNGARFTTVHYAQSWKPGNAVTLSPMIEAVRADGLEVECRLTDPAGKEVGQWCFQYGGTQSYSLDSPERWYPNGMGGQPLYQVNTLLKDADGKIHDEDQHRVGLREIQWMQEDDAWGRSMACRVNGVSFFAKGANWIPADSFPTRVTGADLRDLLESAVAANMNMIRVWGGGIYESPEFYELCDELGLCVWQDFMFACAAYPFAEDAFRESVREEAEQVVRRLRRHTSLVLWCGNNEIEHMPGLVGDQPGAMRAAEYAAAFEHLLPEIVRRLDPGRFYWPSSSHQPLCPRIPGVWENLSGDVHLWAVFHGRKPIDYYRETYPRFCSEFGFQSFPEPATLCRVLGPDNYSPDSPMLAGRQRCDDGNGIIRQYLGELLPAAADHEALIWLSQILQAEAVKTAVTHWRRHQPRCMGALIWQLNDIWPAPSWSSIDHFHRWKALHYAARRFFAPVLLSALPDCHSGDVSIFITCDPGHPCHGKIEWRLFRMDGSIVSQGLFDAVCDGGEHRKLTCLDFRQELHANESHSLILEVRIIRENGEYGVECVAWEPWKNLRLEEPAIQAAWKHMPDGVCQVELMSDKPAPWVWLSCEQSNVRFSDNFLPLFPGEKRRINCTPAHGAAPIGEPSSFVIHTL